MGHFKTGGSRNPSLEEQGQLNPACQSPINTQFILLCHWDKTLLDARPLKSSRKDPIFHTTDVGRWQRMEMGKRMRKRKERKEKKSDKSNDDGGFSLWGFQDNSVQHEQTDIQPGLLYLVPSRQVDSSAILFHCD